MFTVPTFNLDVNIWRTPAVPPVGPPDVIVRGNLAWGRRVNVPSTGGTGVVGVPLMTMTLLLPLLTDIRGDATGAAADLVEVPASSGRLYTVAFCDDIGKGFANEHRAAVLVQVQPFITPTP